MRSAGGSWPLIWQRFKASWRLLAVLGFGMLMAASLTAASPVYTRVMNDVGLRASLEERLGSTSRNTALQIALPLGAPESAVESASLARILQNEVGWFTGSEVRYGVLTNLTYSDEDIPVTTLPDRPLVAIHGASGLESETTLVEGRHAQPTNDPNAIEGVMPASAARVLALSPGDQVAATHTFNDCLPVPPATTQEEAEALREFRCQTQVNISLSANITIVGIVQRSDPNAAYWSAARIPFSTPVPTETMGPVMPVILPEESFFGALPVWLPRVPYTFYVSSLASLDAIDSSEIDAAKSSIGSLEERIREHGALSESPMGDALADFEQRASFNQVTLLLLLLQVVGIAVYYVLLVASLLVERRSEEVAMLRSRGASLRQLLRLSAAEAGGLAIVVVVIAPFVASFAVAALGWTSTFSDISGGGLLAYTIVPEAFLLAAAGAFLSAIAVIVPAGFIARAGLVGFLRGTARPGKLFLQRYYFDVLLVALAGLALWQVNQQGSVFDPQSVGGWSADPLLLLSPILLIAAIGAVIARLLPLLLGLAGRLVAAMGGSAFTLGLWQVTRSPARYIQLALLVVMASAVGTFAATYAETTDRSFEERALFEAGVDYRLGTLGHLDRRSSQVIEESLSSLPGVEQVSTAFRGSVGRGPLPTSGGRIEVLALDPKKAASQLWFRADFSDQSLQSLLSQLQKPETGPPGLNLGEAAAFSIQVNPDVARENTLLWLRTLDANGIYRLHELARLDFTGYRRLEARFDERGIAFPLQLIGLVMTQPTITNLSRNSIYVDDLIAIDTAGNETLLEGFEGPLRWHALATPTRGQDSFVRIEDNATSGGAAGRYLFQAGSSTPVRGIFVDSPNVPLSAVVSTSFLERYGLREGGEVDLVLGNVLLPISIRGSVNLFPTFENENSIFIILNQEQLYEFSRNSNQLVANWPTEAWLDLSSDSAERSAALAALEEEFGIRSLDGVDSQLLLRSVASDPIIRAGGSGILLLALVAAFAILALGFILTLYLGGQARGIEISVLRAVGFSSRQIFAMISLEYLLIAGIGLLTGALAGLQISETMLSFLDVTEDGDRVLPPFLLSTDWRTVMIAFGATFIAFLGGILALALYFLRLPVSRILRLTR